MSASPFGFGAPQMRPEDLARLFNTMPLGAPQGFAPIAENEADAQRLERAMGMVPPAHASPSRPPLSFGAPRRSAAPDSMTVSLPPARPAEFQTSQADLPAVGAQAIMSAAQTTPPAAEGPSFLDRIGTGLRDNGDLLTSLGIGLMSTPGFGMGLASGLQSHQQGEDRRAASRLAEAEYGLKARKLAQEQGAQGETLALLTRNGHSLDMAKGIMAAALAGDRTALNNALNNIVPKNPDAPSGYRLDPATGRAAYIPGGPQDPAMREAEAAATARGAASAKAPESFSLKPGEVRYDSNGVPIASAGPAKPDGFDVESKLRGEFTKNLGTFQEVHDGYGRVLAATEQRQTNPKGVSPASDLSLVFGYMKMLDPGSVVREGEFANAQNAAGIPDRVRNAYNKAMQGEFLTPEQRQDFVESAERLYGKARSNADGVVGRYRGLAENYGVNPERSVYLPPALTSPTVGPSRMGTGLGVGGARDMGEGITVRRVR